MLRTIRIGSCHMVQGILVAALANGKIAVRVGQDVFEGYPVTSAAAG